MRDRGANMLYIILGFFLIVAIVVIVFLTIMLFKNQAVAARYQGVADLDQHHKTVSQEKERVVRELATVNTELEKQKRTLQNYMQVVGVVKTAAEAAEKAKTLKVELDSITEQLYTARSIQSTAVTLDMLKTKVDHRTKWLGITDEISDATKRLDELKSQYNRKFTELKEVEEAVVLQSFGFYQRTYSFETTVAYQKVLDENYRKQKEMVKAKDACSCSIQWIVEGSAEKGKQMADEQIKLMLRAFNGECDAAIAKVKHGNFDNIKKRIEKSFEALNLLGKTKNIFISDRYLSLKIDELVLTHELEQQKEEERERIREERERIREEEKAQKEIIAARNKAEKEEEQKQIALEEARRKLSEEHGMHNAKLESLIAKLENELKEAIDRKAKAIARAQLTKSGHVYVLSNLGTMGPDVFKIGMTRRLDPLERVKELGDASVPFPFDVHAMIFCEDAPGLEYKLHRHFADRRLNLSNNRKEYFRVTLTEIQEAIKYIHGEVTFRIDQEALQYRESESIRNQGLAAEIPLADEVEEDGQ